MSQQSRIEAAPEAIRQIGAYMGSPIKWLALDMPWLERVEVLTDEVLENIHYAMVSSEFDGVKLQLRPADRMTESEKDHLHELLAISPDYPNGIPFSRVFSGEGGSKTFKLSRAMIDYMRSIGVYVVNAIDSQYVELIKQIIAWTLTNVGKIYLPKTLIPLFKRTLKHTLPSWTS